MSAAPLAPWREAEDLRALAGCALMVPVVWLALGWRGDRLVSGYDAIDALFPVVQALVDARGDVSALAYRPDLLGGTAVRDTLGPQPLLVGLAAAGFSATWILNLVTFAVQALLGFFGQRALRDLTTAFGGTPWTVAVRVPLATVFVAFAPYVGWRVGYGHVTLLVGLLPFVAGFALLLASSSGSAGPTLTLASVITMAASLPFVGQQLVLYGVVFGLPLAIGVWLACGGRRSALVLPVLVVAASLMLAAPAFVPMVAHALGADALRQMGRTSVTYSYLTAGPIDWLSSLPWGRFLPPGRPEIQHHESNLPLGPLFLLLALVPRRGRPVLIGIAVSVVLALTFASNVRPISDLLLLAIPPLRSFRVPTRALLPALAVFPVIALAAVAAFRPAVSRLRPFEVLAGLAGAVVLWVSPPLGREVLAWGLAIAVLRPFGFAWRPPTLALLLALAAGSLGAFRERLLPFPDAEGLLAEARSWGAAAREVEPALASPLARVLAVTDGNSPFGANRTLAARLSGLDGYGFPQRRFVALVRALRGEPYAPNALLLRFHEPYPASRVLFQLYNVAWRVDDGPAGQPPRVRALGATAGPAWFPAAVAMDRDWSSLAQSLLGWGEDTHERARAELRMLSDDARVAGLSPALAPECSVAEVRSLGADGNALRLQVTTQAACPLVLATNYGAILEARTGSGQWLQTFPAYGALLGVLVPAGTTDITVAPRAWPPGWTLPVAAMGLLIAGLALRGRTALKE